MHYFNNEDQRLAMAHEVFTDLMCQSVAAVVAQTLHEVANGVSESAVLIAAKIRADERFGNATPQQVSDELKATLNFLSDFVGLCNETNSEAA